MSSRSRIIIIIAVMSFLLILVGTLATYFLYREALQEQGIRLVEMARTGAMIIRSFGPTGRGERLKSWEDSLGQLAMAHNRSDLSAPAIEFALIRSRDGNFEVLFRHHYEGTDVGSSPVESAPQMAGLMNLALRGKSGRLLRRDVAGTEWMIGFAPVPDSPMVLTTGIRIRDIRRPFVRTGGLMATLILLIALAGALLVYRISHRLLRQKLDEIKLMEAGRKEQVEQRENVLQGLVREKELEVTRRERTEQAVIVSDWKYRQIIELVQSGIWLVDRENDTIYCNTALASMLGRRKEELQGKNVRDFVPPDEDIGWLERLRRYQEDYLENTECRFIHRDGTVRYLSISIAPLVQFDGGFSGAVINAIDNTSYRNMFQELRNRQEFSEGLIETARAIVLQLDVEGRIVDFNHFMEELSGYTLREVAGKNWFSTFLPKRIKREFRDLFDAALSKIGTHGNINPIITHDGREVFIEWWDKRLQDQEGNVTGILAIGHDITERIQAEQMLRVNERRLKNAQRMARLGNFEVDFLTGEEFLSETMHYFCGVEPRVENINLSRFCEFIHQDDRENFLNAVYQRGDELSGNDFEIRIMTLTGKERTIRINLEHEYELGGAMLRVHGTAQDVTVLKMQEKMIAAAIEEERKRIGRDLHDGLGQKLTGLSLMMATLKTMARKNQPLPEAMFDQILKLLEEVTGDSQEISRSLFPADVLRKDLFLSLEETAGMLGRIHRVNCTIENPDSIRFGDIHTAAHVYYIINEALNNAIKHGRAENIIVAFRRKDDFIQIEVVDDGKQQDAAKEERIPRSGIGLRGMEYRANLLGGEFRAGQREEGGFGVFFSLKI